MGGTFLISHSFALFETIILFSISTLVLPSNANIYEVAIFTDVNSAGFNHLTVHNDTGDVYVGGVNQVYRLNAGLELTASVTTGPEYGDDEVYDTFNKILKINYDDSELITCGGYQGVCQKRHIHDLSVTYENGDPIFVVANTTDETTVGYVAPNHLGKPMLYVGSTSTSANAGSPLVSGRQLQGNQIFMVIEDSRGTTRVDVALSLINTFPVSYVAGFSYSGYSYFVTTQKSSTSGSEYISKLVRVCQRAESNYFNSYTEVTLKCRDDSYNLAQAAYLARPGQDLTQSLALDDDEAEEVLFVSFAVGAYNPPTPAKQSAICMYKMSTIKRAFQDAVEGCMESEGLPAYSASWMQGATCVGCCRSIGEFTNAMH
ncbi:plexin A3-like [Ptychodera flava]|uniref:plexin A3-like n=1 Tax=Ptychodera flava TaxID=63121 RepID=UPI00396AA23F